MKNKIQVYSPKPYISIDNLEGDINDVVKFLTDIPNSCKERLAELKEQKGFRYDPMWDLIDEYKINIDTAWLEETNLTIDTFRDETDEEEKRRLEMNKKRSEAAKKAAITKKESQLKREKTLYENLKKKFDENSRGKGG